MKFIIEVKGHPNIIGRHKSTWQITKDPHLTIKGDCIIGVSASKGAIDLPFEFKQHLKEEKWYLVSIEIDDNSIISGRFKGNNQMKLSSIDDMVFRKSEFVCDRTIGISGEFVAKDIPRDFIRRIKNMDVNFKICISFD